MPTYPPRIESLPDLFPTARTAAKDRVTADQQSGEVPASPAPGTRPSPGRSVRRVRSASKPGSWQRHMAESRKSAVLERYWHTFAAWCASRHLTWPSA